MYIIVIVTIVLQYNTVQYKKGTERLKRCFQTTGKIVFSSDCNGVEKSHMLTRRVCSKYYSETCLNRTPYIPETGTNGK